MSDSQLIEISIRGVGVIEEATLEIGKGLTVFTGETGAGKTMVLTALSLLLGGKAEGSLVRVGKERLLASATFSISNQMSESVLELGGAIEDGQLILTRSITSDGKSKAAAGGVPVPAAILAGLAETLIEIHGQSANMSITKPAKQRDILDAFGGAEMSEALSKYTKDYESYQVLRKKLHSLRDSSASRDREISGLIEFAEAFKKVKPKVGETYILAQEISRLSSIESLRTSVGEAARALDDEDTGAMYLIAKARRNLESVQDKDLLIAKILENVTEGFYLLSDATESTHKYLSDLELDPEKLERALTRKSEINGLLKRFAQFGETDALIGKFELIEERIADLAGGEDRITAMEQELAGAWQELCRNAELLSKLRKVYAVNLSKLVSEEIHGLAMPHTQFVCKVVSPEYEKEIPLNALSGVGADDVSMLLQSQKNGALVALAKGASGGEMSRVMLGLEVVLASSQPVGTYIFDEVDAGVGGRAAIDVGRRLFELSRHAQVLVVTHLPQVAAWADTHFVLKKNDDGAVSQSDVTEVRAEARVEEIARMLAGHEHSLSAREHAAELLGMRGVSLAG